MQKKKIKPEDLELNVEIVESYHPIPKFTDTRTCPHTKNNCGDATFDAPQVCDTTTTDPTEQNCISIVPEDCKPTQKCPLTIEPACETQVGCIDSNSHAVICCPISQNGMTCDNCHTVETCGPDTQCLCLISKNICESDDHQCHISGEDETCKCTNTLNNTCEPTIIDPNTFHC